MPGGTQQIVGIDYHGFGLAQNLPSGFGDGNMVEKEEFQGFSHVFNKKSRHTA